MEAKFKVGDRVVVKQSCYYAMGYAGEVDQFKESHGVIVGVFTYETLQADYDVIIDGHEAQNAKDCPGFEEDDLLPESA